MKQMYDKAWYALGIPEELVTLSKEAFDDVGQAIDWFHQTNAALNNKSPLQKLDEEGGGEKVADVIRKIISGEFM